MSLCNICLSSDKDILKCNICLSRANYLLKCNVCTYVSCDDCIITWYTKNKKFPCPQCRNHKTFDINDEIINSLNSCENYEEDDDELPPLGILIDANTTEESIGHESVQPILERTFPIGMGPAQRIIVSSQFTSIQNSNTFNNEESVGSITTRFSSPSIPQPEPLSHAVRQIPQQPRAVRITRTNSYLSRNRNMSISRVTGGLTNNVMMSNLGALGQYARNIITPGQIFAPDNFTENYENWPRGLKSRFIYEELKMNVNGTEEIVGYIVRERV